MPTKTRGLLFIILDAVAAWSKSSAPDPKLERGFGVGFDAD